MRFGVREICDVVFKAKSRVKIGNKIFEKGQPVLYIDSAKTSTIEGAATTVYATGGKGNTRLIAWEGEKTLTFTVEDALLSPIGFSVLSGAGLIKTAGQEKVHVHQTSAALMTKDATTGRGKIDLADALGVNQTIDKTAPIFVVKTEGDGSVTGDIVYVSVDEGETSLTTLEPITEQQETVFVDYYVARLGSKISEIQIDAANFAGYYYVEASTLFRRQEDGVDMPAEITFPNVKIQSNFTFSMASTGDPSTFTFTMDAFPASTYFDPTKKVLCVIQVIEDAEGSETDLKTVMGHTNEEGVDETDNDSVPDLYVKITGKSSKDDNIVTFSVDETVPAAAKTYVTVTPSTYTIESGDTTTSATVTYDFDLDAYNAANNTAYKQVSLSKSSETLTWAAG